MFYFKYIYLNISNNKNSNILQFDKDYGISFRLLFEWDA